MPRPPKAPDQLLEVASHVFTSPTFDSVVAEAIEFFEGTQHYPLPPSQRFMGEGVYGLYYLGDFEPYQPITTANADSLIQPIYVGKAVPPGWRTTRGKVVSSTALFGRLREHAKSIQLVGLDPAHFHCRFMILADKEGDLIGPVEAALIRHYRPIWNAAIDGFGNHDPGAGRYNQARSHWDILHPGRPWVVKLTGVSLAREDVLDRIQKFFTLPVEKQIALAEQSLFTEDDEA